MYKCKISFVHTKDVICTAFAINSQSYVDSGPICVCFHTNIGLKHIGVLCELKTGLSHILHTF